MSISCRVLIATEFVCASSFASTALEASGDLCLQADLRLKGSAGDARREASPSVRHDAADAPAPMSRLAVDGGRPLRQAVAELAEVLAAEARQQIEELP